MIEIRPKQRDMWLRLMHSLLWTNTDEVYDSFGNVEKHIVTVTTGSTAAVTVDLKSQNFVDMIRWKQFVVNSIPIQNSLVQEWEKILSKLDALKAIAGMYYELNEDQQDIFDEVVKRRTLF